MKIVIAVCLCLASGPGVAPQAPVPRDALPPALVSAQRERQLKATINAGTATAETYKELVTLLTRQKRLLEAIDALRGAATVEPQSGDRHLAVAKFAADYIGSEPAVEAALKKSLLKQAMADVERALELDPELVNAGAVRQALRRMLDAADTAAFSGFSEPFEQSLARLQPLRVGGNIRTPTKVKNVSPVYPADAQSARLQGVVILEALIGPEGRVENARVLRSIEQLDAAAVAAVSRWEFTPTQVNGAAAAVLMTVTVNFTLQ